MKFIRKKVSLHHIDNYKLNALIMCNKLILLLTACLSATALSAQNTTKTDSTKTQKLEEVVVTQRRQLIKNDIDKLTYDVQHDKTAQTKTTLEILKKIPLVTVDGQENIKVQGSTSFKVYRNGHPDPSFSGRTLRRFSRQYPLLPSRESRLSPTPVPSMMQKELRLSSTSS